MKIDKIEEEELSEKIEDKGLTPNNDNGYDFENYRWTQNALDLTLYLPLPDSIKSRDLKVDIRPTSLSIMNKISNKVLFEGELFSTIKVENSTWLINNDSDKRELVVEMDKKKFDEWLPVIRKGDKEIDLSLVRPPNANISDLDQETRSTIAKMQFDQEQKEKAGFYKDK